jgi:putative ABC transport system permease protein
MLLVGALLMIRTFFILRPTDPGFDFTNKIVANVALPAPMSAEAKDQFAAELSRQLLASPGVAAVARVSQLPVAGTRSFIPFILDGQAGEKVTETFTTNISANFLDVLQIRIVRGRGLLESDNAGAEPVTLANEAFVRRWLNGREPLNAAVTIGPGVKPTIQRRIVGIVPDMRFTGSDLQPRPQLFFPIAQSGAASNYIISATPSALATMPSTVRQIVTTLKPDQLVDRIDLFEKLLNGEVAYPRLGAWLLGIFGGLAVLLSAIGLGSTLAWSVAERRREIGVRMALGASPGAIRALVVRQTLALVLIALAIGLTSAVFASRLVDKWLYGVARTDVLTYAICGASMLAVALVAAYLPARRATRVDPLTALRSE